MSKRTRAWWARLTTEEQYDLWHLERHANPTQYHYGWPWNIYLREGRCKHCGAVSDAVPLCERCNGRRLRLIAKADVPEPPARE